MEFKAIVDPKARGAADCALVGVYENGDLTAAARQIDGQIGGIIGRLHAGGDFAGKLGDTLLLPHPAGAASTRVLLAGLGSRAGFGRKQYRKALQASAQALSKTGARDALLFLALEEVPQPRQPLPRPHRGRSVPRTGLQDSRSEDRRETQAAELDARQCGGRECARREIDAAGLEASAPHSAAVSPSRATSRTCRPTSAPRPTSGTVPRALAKEWPRIKTRVFDEKGIKDLKMGAFLAVTQGSAQPPRLIVCEYRGAKKAGAPICLVGKGITFDSGGISLKDPPAMDEMKFDMSGAATVLGAVRAAAELALPINVVAIVAACENMPSGGAVKPSDIVTSMSGQTVEILNTDAEGRLVLCDAITYSRRYKPAAVIDVATLTGACVVALGAHFSGLMSNDEALADELIAAGARADDRAWRMPIGDEYAEQLKSNFADLANVGGREGGACTAATFLSKFAKDLTWAHLDVAGTAWLGGSQKGSTGRPVAAG